MFAKLAIVVNVLVYIVDIYIYIYIVVYVVCGVVFRVVCCVVPLYLQASVAEAANIRSVMVLLKVHVLKRKRSLTPTLREDAPVHGEDEGASLQLLDNHFKEIDGMGMSVDVEA